MNPAANLFLVGPMGAGKSSIGRRLARHFGLAFHDLDEAIEAHTGASVALIFEMEGEDGFRRRETQVLEALAAHDGVLVATGGGAVLRAENRAVLRERGFVVWLRVDVHQQLRRLARDTQRPLLRTADRREKLETLAREREPHYREVADLEMPPSDAPVPQVSAALIARIEASWQRLPATNAAVATPA